MTVHPNPSASRHRLVCPHDCPDACGLIVTADGGRIVRTDGDPEHPYTRGFICGKVRKRGEWMREGRLTHPLRRVGRKGEGRFERISWDSALDEIHRRFSEIISKNGAEAILPYHYGGNMGFVQRWTPLAFWHRLGASRLMHTICYKSAEAGFEMTLGGGVGTPAEHAERSDFLLVWGCNVAATNIHFLPALKELRKKGLPTAMVDVYPNKTAKFVDHVFIIRPATDAALALGIMHLLEKWGLADREYIRERTLGYEKLREEALPRYSPRRTSEITGLAERDIEKLARLYGEARAPFIRLGMGMSRHRAGGMAVRTVCCLPGAVGAFARPGGGLFVDSGAYYPLNKAALSRPDLSPSPPPREVNMCKLGEALLDLDGPPVDALFVYQSNPAAVAPAQGRVRRGLEREDLFVVVHELFHTATTRYADLVLPATTVSEHFDVFRSYGHRWMQWNHPCLPPPGEAKSNRDLFAALAARFGFAEIYRTSAHDDARALFSDPYFDDLDRASLEAGLPVAHWKNEEKLPYEEGFPTPSGRLEFFSRRMADLGLNPLPEWKEETAPPGWIRVVSAPGEDTHNSSLVPDAGENAEPDDPPVLMMNPATFNGEFDAQNGGKAILENKNGCLKVRIFPCPTLPEGYGVIEGFQLPERAPDGWNYNVLTDERTADLAEANAFNGAWCGIRLL